MKNLFVKQIIKETAADASAVPALMDTYGIEFTPIQTVNWPDYPYCPEVKFRIAHTQTAILLHYQVTEASVRAAAAEDDGRVWEDACVEFFLSPDSNDVYYNFECSCIGKLLLHGGLVGTERPGASIEVLQSVKRWTTLGTEPFEERVGECTWEAALIIPVSALFQHEISNLSGKVMQANFYKCGDLLQTPHFLSWNPIDLPQPCFHCPPFFGTLEFE